MKKRTMAFGGLLVAVVVTAYSVAGTYAKYISGTDAIEEARVAKWSFGVNEYTTDIKDLFKASYTKVSTKVWNIVYTDKTSGKELINTYGGQDFSDEEACKTALADLSSTGDTINDDHCKKTDSINDRYVASLNGDDVVAPGTNGAYTFAISGEMETNYILRLGIDGYNGVKLTAAEINKAAETNTSIKTVADDYVYDPIKFRITAIDDNDTGNWMSFDDALKVLEDLIPIATSTGSNSIENVNAPGTITGGTYKIEWAWAYDTTEADEIDSISNNEYDTLLGNKIVKAITAGEKAYTTADDGKITGNAKYPAVTLKVTMQAEQTQCKAGMTIAACEGTPSEP